MRVCVVSISLLALFLICGTATAGDRVAVGVKVGSLGVGAELDVRLTNHFAVSLAASAYEYDRTDEDSGITYDSTLDLDSMGVLLDWYPFAGSFHLTAGYFENENRLSAIGVPGPGDVFEIGGMTYTAAEVGDLTAAIEFDDTAPYFGLGWGNPFKGRKLSFELDLGIYKQGNADVILATSQTVPGLPAELAAEEAELEEDLEDYDFWPVIQIGLAWRF
jgi:hypothetical protein